MSECDRDGELNSALCRSRCFECNLNINAKSFAEGARLLTGGVQLGFDLELEKYHRELRSEGGLRIMT